MRVLLETDNAIVRFDEQKKAILVKWSGDPSEKEFKLVYTCVQKSFKIYFVNLLINDFANLNILTPFQINLLSDHIIPIAFKCGLRNLINVSSNSGVVEGFTEQIESTFNAEGKSIKAQTTNNFNKAFERITV